MILCLILTDCILCQSSSKAKSLEENAVQPKFYRRAHISAICFWRSFVYFLHESACKLLCYVSLRSVPSQSPTIRPIENRTRLAPRFMSPCSLPRPIDFAPLSYSDDERSNCAAQVLLDHPSARSSMYQSTGLLSTVAMI